MKNAEFCLTMIMIVRICGCFVIWECTYIHVDNKCGTPESVEVFVCTWITLGVFESVCERDKEGVVYMCETEIFTRRTKLVSLCYSKEKQILEFEVWFCSKICLMWDYSTKYWEKYCKSKSFHWGWHFWLEKNQIQYLLCLGNDRCEVWKQAWHCCHKMVCEGCFHVSLWWQILVKHFHHLKV